MTSRKAQQLERMKKALTRELTPEERLQVDKMKEELENSPIGILLGGKKKDT